MDEKASPGDKVSYIQRIEALNTRLENARKTLAAHRVFLVLNKQGHYVVFAPQEGGSYIVNAEGCCTDEQRSVESIEGYCEHRLAVDLFKEAQGEKGQPDENVGKVEVPTVGGDIPSLTEQLANAGNVESKVAYSNGSYKSS